MAEIDYTIEINPITNYTIELNEQGPQGLTGESGTNATITGVTASVDGNVGIPSVNVTLGGTESERTFDFAFHNLKGADGAGSVNDVKVNGTSVVNQGIASVIVPTDNTELTNGAGYITNINSSDVTTALGYTPADENLSNLSSTGQSILDNKLNQQQITNCLLEVPQRMQYTLVDGTLTLLEGSVVIIPYGATDQSSTITVGSTFINSALKVVDTYWDSTNSKFFVWIELQSDIVRAATSSSTVNVRRAFLNITSSSVSIANSGNTASTSADTDITQSTVVFYNTTDNLVKSKQSGTIQSNVYSFPLLVNESDMTYNVASIKQVFNGIGYIGSVIWTDKGIKGLIPNGRNVDGSLNNTEFTTSGLYIRDMSTVSDGRKVLLLRAQGISRLDDYYSNYDAISNYNINRGSGPIGYAYVGKFYVSSGVITSGVFEEAISINSLCDGDWVNYNLTLAQSVAYPTVNDITYDLTDYLPKDNNMYQVLLTGSVRTGNTVGDRVDLNVRTDVMFSNVLLTQAVTVSTKPNRGDGNGMFFVGEGRTVIVKANTADWSSTSEQPNGIFNLYARGYRRVGTNN